MPKMKTHSGAKKRFKKTGRGKWLHEHPQQRHLLIGMSRKRGRFLRRKAALNKVQGKIMNRFQPYA